MKLLQKQECYGETGTRVVNEDDAQARSESRQPDALNSKIQHLDCKESAKRLSKAAKDCPVGMNECEK